MAYKIIAVSAIFLMVFCTAFSSSVKGQSSHYSSSVGQEFPDQLLFGDTHLHTSYSVDAGMGGNTLGPEDAYRFAMGQEVVSTTGLKAKLKRPLDFLVVADHAENLGLAPLINRADPILIANPGGRKYYDLIQSGKRIEAFLDWLQHQGIAKDPIDDPAMIASAWKDITDIADAYNKPGYFSAIIGFEWTSNADGNNLHRNVLFRGDAARAQQAVPFSAYDSSNPEDLWDWMAAYEQQSGDQVLAIPHNGNLSNGLMFAPVKLGSDVPLDEDYARRRQRWEPVVEVVQGKGTGEAHPYLSPDDEFADFSLIDNSNLIRTKAKTPDMLAYEYARSALKNGLVWQQRLGVNPFQFGMIGSSDAHGSLATAEEGSWFGKASVVEPSADRWQYTLIKSMVDPDLSMYAKDLNASGVAAVWARDNSRESIWDAFKRREVYATSGSRIRVRVFGGFGFDERDLHRSDYVEHGYATGVPMGGKLSAAASGQVPTFLVYAQRDPDGANLDRLQLIKGWLDDKGQTHERIYDLAVSGKRKIDRDGRAREAVGSTVDVQQASYDNSIGAPVLQSFWRDPDFDPALRAFYYIRVIEIPTPTWLAKDRAFYDIKDMPDDLNYVTQDRAYTSPIWYSPSAGEVLARAGYQ